MTDESRLLDRIMSMVLAAPPLGLALTVMFVALAAALGRDPFWYETPMTISEAAAVQDGGAIVRLVAAGADPSARTVVRAGILTDAALRLTPLQAAVGAGASEMVDLLIREGAKLDDESAVVLICIAQRLNRSELRRRLQELAGLQRPPDCEGVVTPW